MTLKVFISYKREYLEFASAVKDRIREWGYGTWFDVDDIAEGTYFRHAIQEGLETSQVMVGVLTENAIRSREVQAEWDYFFIKQKEFIPLRKQDIEPPYHLLTIQYIDFVADEALAFEKLHKRLGELAVSLQKEGTASLEKPGAAVIEDVIQQESERKKEALDDGLFGGAILSQAPQPQPAPPPPPLVQPPAGATTPLPVMASQPASAPFQPARQPQPMPQSIALGGTPRAKRSSPILWSLAAVASLVIIVGAVILFSSSAAFPTLGGPQQPGSQETSPLVWIGLVAVIGAVGFIAWWRFGRRSAVPDAQTEAANRATMLQNVEDFWLKGVLDPALEAGSLDIGLSGAPGAVLRHKDYGDYALPPNANILDVFNDLNRELLILGAPGGGKTVLLLQLAKELINQARQDGNKPIPAIFNLSSWATKHKPLADWLVDELQQKYQMPGTIAQAWVSGDKLLLLLDGLDEVYKPYQNDCIEAINKFREQHRTVDLAICSRTTDYDLLTSKLDLRGAIIIQ